MKLFNILVSIYVLLLLVSWNENSDNYLELVPEDDDKDVKEFINDYPNTLSDVMTLGEVKTYTIMGLDYETKLI